MQVFDPATQALWCDPDQGVIPRMARALAQRGVHPARCVVLVPYAQLIFVARWMWQQCHPSGFLPRFETTLNWSQSLGAPQPGADDLRFDAGTDTLTARSLLERAGLAAQRELLAPAVLDAARQLAPVVAAVPPGERDAWAEQARATLGGALIPHLVMETAASRIALEWVLASAWPTDALWDAALGAGQVDALLVVRGFDADPLADALLAALGTRAEAFALVQQRPAGHVLVHACQDAEDEAQRAAACVLRHVADRHTPVALVAIDRALTRRIRAMLGAQGLVVRDESGWKLSTTRAAASLMALLRAGVWDASGDEVLDWLKHAPAMAGVGLAQLERHMRRAAAADWRSVAGLKAVQEDEGLRQLVEAAQTLLAALRGPRALPQWLLALRQALERSGQWSALQQDEAGVHLIDALRLADGGAAELSQLPQAARRMDLPDFTRWVNEVLEAASFKPEYPEGEQVIVLPLNQLLGRPMGAVVLAGCDEVRLNPAPELPGIWTPAQRQALGLPGRESLQAAVQAAWTQALQRSAVDILWRGSDDGGEPLQRSPLVQALALGGAAPAEGADPRGGRWVAAQVVARPLPSLGAGDLGLQVQRLSASAYDDLRRCPYRFFALRMLGLQASDELDDGLDKRDFGLWLHEVLSRFHVALQAAPQIGADRLALLEATASAVTAGQALSAAAFLPFAAAWPAVRDGYLKWLEQDERSGATFDSAERWLEASLDHLTLVGQVDRIDHIQVDGQTRRRVVDYKTESLATTRNRVRDPGEDTQLPFYAALLGDADVSAAYLHVGESDGCVLVGQPDVLQARDALRAGISADMQRIAQGHPLPALGDGATCDFCAARGLCRKDHWTT